MPQTFHTTIIAAIGALTLLLAACTSSDDSATPEESTTTTVAATTAEPTTTSAEETDAEDEASPATFDPDAMPLTVEFELLENGVYLVDTLGTPFSFEVSDSLFVQPNSDALFVISSPNSRGPDDRDLVFSRVSDLSDPTQPAAAVEDQEAWPASDIEGWLDALVDDVVISDRTETTVGGRSAVQFDMQLSDDAQCGGDDDSCVAFVTNRLVNGHPLERGALYRTWWIDEGDESPIAIIAAVDNDSQLDWFDTAESVLGSLNFGDTSPNPIPAEGDLWTLGFSSEVPAGPVEVPILGGLRFELPEDEFIFQSASEGVIVVEFGDDQPANSEFQFIIGNQSGDPIVTAQDAIDELAAAGAEVIELESTTVAGFPTRVVDISGSESNSRPIFTRFEQDPFGWGFPMAGRLWFIDSDRGLLMATAEAFTPDAPLEDVIAQTTSIVSTLEFIELS